MRKITTCIAAVSLLQIATLNAQNWNETTNGNIKTVSNKNGQTLGYAASSGVKLLIVDGFAFKDLNKNGKLDKYEDWRLPADVRAKDLASQMSVEQIAGLMLYSRHQPIPSPPAGFFASTYGGKKFPESGAKASDLTDQQKEFLTKDNVRHVLVTSVQSPEVAAEWNNNVQALAEGIGMGIPANNSSDPRHGTVANAEFNAGAGGTISMWPGSLGLAATFDPAVVKQFGNIAAQEYRALGIATALSPQIDMASEPRWNRFSGTFGENSKLAADMARAYTDGFQTSAGDKEIKDGWGYNSVNAMVKHWPGGGSGEAGRDAHYGFGKYAVYPGNNFAEHMIPFTEGAFKLDGKTKMAAAVMPYYTISWNQDTKYHENVANNYNKYIITDLLRKKYHYDGVVCTDWLVTGDETAVDVFITGKSWGVDSLTLAQRHYKILMAGVDQFGGNNDAAPVIEAFNIGVKEHGEKF
ncbi:MAG TPA: glycoside hydrolase family 3 N-terminal domain-containing protein, partial [Panacibacter sp.]|nr:glycoside hydrolase family 3 N-terminal domain-containing protein [Panacibacter sp.]